MLIRCKTKAFIGMLLLPLLKSTNHSCLVSWSRCLFVHNYSQDTLKLFLLHCWFLYQNSNHVFENKRKLLQLKSDLSFCSLPLHVHNIPLENATNPQWLGCNYLYMCKGHVWACGPSWESPTKALILGSKLIKAVDQMVQTWSGHNETVSCDTKLTWQDSCEEFIRWPEFRLLPGD